ncbi:MAG: branched-chain amino acid ABC transporter permease [bacterium]|nr:branched-chain amino acid ABC transporter permease [bacterium]
MDYFLQQTINAVSLGGTYALLALGMAVIFSIMGMINFAHGELMTITGYMLFFSIASGVPWYFAVPLALVAGILAAMAMEIIAFRPVRGATAATLLVTSFAVSGILQVLFQNLISTRPKAVPLPDFLSNSFSIGPLTLGINQTLSILATITTLVFLVLFFKKTFIGMAMRSAAEDFPVTRLMGIPANAVVSGAFAISGLLAAIAGTLWVAQRASVDPLMGFVPVVKAFIAAILGGLGSLAGAVAGGFSLGFIEIYMSAFLPHGLQAYKEPLGLLIVILILVWKPNGLIPAAKMGIVK